MKAAQPASAPDSEPQDLIAIGPRQWRRVKYLSDQFWIKFRWDYLSELQRRNKWKTPRRRLKCGDLVLVRDKTTDRLHWPMGLVQFVKTSADGLVRSATIRTIVTKNSEITSRIYERPIGELVLLEATPV
ncbi:hypothetical protein HAZT_HAZT010866 [Hyalella azteca]|uniref:DUF5641 domain-containing protein n=1 Tax=Hyalella azteca TaxID=294128 RepID=A0A6A0H4X5_HYAAZ|nr:hypothetical protein HAZT_HAZT010866 [Hyalella azteca]